MIVIIALDCDDDQFCVLLKNVLRGNLFNKVFRVTLSMVEEGTIVFSRVCWISVLKEQVKHGELYFNVQNSLGSLKGPSEG